MASTYYATQGGGTAYKVSGDQYAWIEPAPGIGAKPGDLVPSEWCVEGPFDSETNRLLPNPRYDASDDMFEWNY
ncbi:MAG: hypothetical protein JWN75_373 [Candidatus Saccharibacteria bacterium]|nr:hypothetical protein [Candidatus Saccharibacteria bacterium]